MNENVLSNISQVDSEALENITDESIDCSEIPELTEAFFKNAYRIATEFGIGEYEHIGGLDDRLVLVRSDVERLQVQIQMLKKLKWFMKIRGSSLRLRLFKILWWQTQRKIGLFLRAIFRVQFAPLHRLPAHV
jgi:hypothetical protein